MSVTQYLVDACAYGQWSFGAMNNGWTRSWSVEDDRTVIQKWTPWTPLLVLVDVYCLQLGGLLGLHMVSSLTLVHASSRSPSMAPKTSRRLLILGV